MFSDIKPPFYMLRVVINAKVLINNFIVHAVVIFCEFLSTLWFHTKNFILLLCIYTDIILVIYTTKIDEVI